MHFDAAADMMVSELWRRQFEDAAIDNTRRVIADFAERMMLRRYRAHHEVRQLIAASGVENLQIAPWILLLAHATLAEKKLGRSQKIANERIMS